MNETVYLFALSSPDLLQRILALPAAPVLTQARTAPTQAAPAVHVARAA